MIVLLVLAGWVALAAVLAPLAGRFIAAGTHRSARCRVPVPVPRRPLA